MRTFKRICFVGLLATTFVAGCGRSNDGPPRVSARGTVFLDGQPLPAGLIRFVPVDDTKGPKSQAVIEEGAFEFPKNYGPVPGTHRVEIEAVESDLPDPDDEAAVLAYAAARKARPRCLGIPPIYNRRSQLKEVVSPEAAKEFRFELVSTR
jgi:hypothetical protein